ncbi:MAG TPA: discoidin domain-containing protein, partial [bacterium]
MNALHLGKTVSLALFTVLAGSYALQSATQIEADWLRQEQLRGAGSVSAGSPVTPDQDASGACDGVKDGAWGFHTERQDDPWWQIDLGESTSSLDRVVIFNRCDFPGRAARLIVLLSDDGKTFRRVYQHDGTPFFG